ncbi:MAG TPA: hypothetical protein VK633_02215, partial [Verrucomicrobiae bacterium]|nr:hypothetical protein [Verrucomicrobiae bacterium]
MAPEMVAAEHIDDEDIIVTIAIKISDIDAHRRETNLAQRQGCRSAEDTPTVVQPHAVGRSKIITDVE